MFKKQPKPKPETPPITTEEEEDYIDLTPIVDKLTIVTVALEKLNSDLSSILTKVVTTLDILNKKEVPEIDNSEINNKLTLINQTLSTFVKSQDQFNKIIASIKTETKSSFADNIPDSTEEKRLLNLIAQGIQATNSKLDKEPKKTWTHQIFKDDSGIYKVVSTSS